MPEKIQEALALLEAVIVAEYGQDFFDSAIYGELSRKELALLFAEFAA